MMRTPENENDKEKPIEDQLYELKVIYCELEVKDTLRDILYVQGMADDKVDETIEMLINEMNDRKQRRHYK